MKANCIECYIASTAFFSYMYQFGYHIYKMKKHFDIFVFFCGSDPGGSHRGGNISP